MTDSTAQRIYEATRQQLIESQGEQFLGLDEHEQHEQIMKTFVEFSDFLKAQKERQD